MTISHNNLKEIFAKYDLNNDHKIDESELNNLVTDVLKQNKNNNELNEEDIQLISKTVKDLIKLRDLDNSKTLDLDEFTRYLKGKNILEDSERKFY